MQSSKPRNLKPRPAVTAPAVTITDLTCFDVVGLTGDQLRIIVRKHGVRHVMIGQRMIVRVDDWLAFLDRSAEQGVLAPALDELDDPETPTSAAGVLAMLGRRSA